jgi:hypothetical protein
MQESCHSIAGAVAIAVRYAASRRQFGELRREIPLIEYELHVSCPLSKAFGHHFTLITLPIVRFNISVAYIKEKKIEKVFSGTLIVRQTIQSCQTSPVDFQPYYLPHKAQIRLRIFVSTNLSSCYFNISKAVIVLLL